MNKIIIAYIPVIHQGYINLFQKYEGIDCYVLNREMTYKYRPLEKDIRALEPETIRDFIATLKIFNKVEMADEKWLENMSNEEIEIVMPDEDYMHELREKYYPHKKVIFESIFLRWDKDNAAKKNVINNDHKISRDEFDSRIICRSQLLAEKSGDWWRQIGAIIVKDKKIVLEGHNHHVPDEQMPYVNGDPRASFSKGVNIELSTAIHGEAYLIARAAEKGISLEGTSIYTSTFPCPPCAKLIAYSGIKKLYYSEGYSMLDGESILKSQGVEIIRVL